MPTYNGKTYPYTKAGKAAAAKAKARKTKRGTQGPTDGLAGGKPPVLGGRPKRKIGAQGPTDGLAGGKRPVLGGRPKRKVGINPPKPGKGRRGPIRTMGKRK